LQGIVSFSTSGAFLAAIDSSVPDLWLPRPICDAFEQAFGLTYQNKSNRYVIQDSIHTQLQSLNPNITFQLGNSTKNTGKTTNIVLPYAAFDLQASWPISNRSTNYFPLRRAVNESQYTLGRVFLQEAYLIVDFERQNFTIAQARFPDAKTAPDIVPIISTAENSSQRPRIIAGISIAVFVAVVLIVFTMVYLSRRRRAVRRMLEAQVEADNLGEMEHTRAEMDSQRKLEKDGAELRVELPSTEIQEMSAEAVQELDSTPVKTARS
jgi:hypothetical protein